MSFEGYYHYFLRVLGDGLLSTVGLTAVVLLVIAIAAWRLLGSRPGMRQAVFWVALTGSVVCLATGFYSGIYEYDERPEEVVFETLPAGEPDCGTAWSAWIKSNYGLNNSCEQGCYRGKVLRKQMRMSGFPPWPEYRREMQCWRRDPVDR